MSAASGGAAGGVVNYARAASTPSERNLIHLKLFRVNKEISFNLMKKEKASLLFRKMKLPPANVKSFEASNFKRLTIELQGDIDIEQYKFSSALKIREGLSVMPMKELKMSSLMVLHLGWHLALH